MQTNRMEKVDNLVKQALSKIIFSMIPEEVISVTQVQVTKDLNFAKVWISSLEDIDRATQKCIRLTPEIRKELAANVSLRKTPKLHFVPDKTEEEAQKIEKIILEIK